MSGWDVTFIIQGFGKCQVTFISILANNDVTQYCKFLMRLFDLRSSLIFANVVGIQIPD